MQNLNNNIMSYIESANIYGIKPSFYVKRKDTYFTKFTLFISIISILVIAFFIIYFGKDLLYRTKQNLLFSTITDKEPLALNLSSSNFVLSFSLQYENYTSFIDNKIYNIKAYLVSSYIDKEINEKIINYTSLEVVKCSNYHFNLISDFFKTKDLNNLYCLNNSNLIIKGGFDNENYQFIKIEFNFCDNNSINYICEDLESIKKKFKGGYVTIFYSDLSIQSNNYSHPAVINGRNKVTTFSSNYYKEFTLFFKNKIIQTDKGLVFTKIDKSYYYSFESSEEFIDFRNYNYNFFNLFIRASSEHDEYLRSYTKATSVIADISGMFKLIMIIGYIICYTTDLIFYKLYILSFFDLNYNFDIDSKKNNTFSLINVVKNMKEKDETSLKNVGKMPSLYQIYEIDNRHRKDRNKVLKTIIMTKNSIHSTKFNDIKKKVFCKENNNINTNINTTYFNNNSNNNSINNNNNIKSNSYRNDYILNKYKENFNLYDFNQNLHIYKAKSLRHKRIKLKEMRNENMEKNLSCCNLFYLAFCEKSKKTIYGKKLSNFQNISIYLDIIRYLKIFHDLHLLKRYILSDKDFKKIESDYLFDKNSKTTTELFYNNFDNYFQDDNKKTPKKKDKKEKKSEKKTVLKKEEVSNKTKISNNNSTSRNEKKWNVNNTKINEINISILNKNDLDDIKIKFKKKKKKKTVKNKNLDNNERDKQEKSNNNLLSTDYI